MTDDLYPLDPTHDEPAPTDEERSADPLTVLASYLMPDGRLRVPGLVVFDEHDRDLVELSAGNREARVTVRLPSPPAHGRTEVSVRALDGDPGDDTVDPSLGVDVTVDGNQAAVLDVTPDQWGGWDLNVSTPVPDDRL